MSNFVDEQMLLISISLLYIWDPSSVTDINEFCEVVRKFQLLNCRLHD